jgi:hypothetical protein
MVRGLMMGLGAIAAVTVLATTPAWAQERGIRVYANVGGLSALRDLNQAGTADFRTGFDMEGGVGWQLQRNLSVRGDLTWGQQQLRNSGIATGKVNQFFYGADVMLKYPGASRATPYVFAGGGAVTIHPKGTSGENKTNPFGRLGLGVTYQPTRSRLELFAQGTGWLYKISGFSGTNPLAGYDRSQFDLAYSGGVSVRL